jgi:hypothetical protein
MIPQLKERAVDYNELVAGYEGPRPIAHQHALDVSDGNQAADQSIDIEAAYFVPDTTL